MQVSNWTRIRFQYGVSGPFSLEKVCSLVVLFVIIVRVQPGIIANIGFLVREMFGEPRNETCTLRGHTTFYTCDDLKRTLGKMTSFILEIYIVRAMNRFP